MIDHYLLSLSLGKGGAPHMRRSVAIVLGLSFTLGCAFQKPVSFNSEPTGARLRVGGRDIGTTPVLAELKCRTGKHEEREYQVSKEGYRKQSGELDYEVSARNLTIDILFF